MAVYSVNTTRVEHSDSGVLRWHLDSPGKENKIESSELARHGILFRGWMLLKEEVRYSLVILNGNDIIPLQVEQPRPDVISRVLKEAPDNHRQLNCGFSQTIKLQHASFSLGMIIDGKFTELLSGSINGIFQILKGADKWLFLDNDSNKSVEQFTGQVKLSRTARSEWKAYLKAVNQYSADSGLPVCLLIAPAKETVYDEHYPFKASPKAPINELIRLVPDSLSFLYPVEALKCLKQRSFKVCDTHWTLHGARKASQLLASELTSTPSEAFDVFSHDVYDKRKVAGDLGSKLYPPQRHVEDNLKNFSYRNAVIYDNHVDNFGRIIVMFHEGAVLNKTLLLFGSSSSYIMFHYLARLFTTVVFVHTAGNVDHDIIKVVAPDYMCLQTNARFVVQAPKFDDSVKNYIAQKKASGSVKKPEIATSLPADREALISYLKHM